MPAVERRWPKAEAISIIYDGTVDGSPARRLMVDFWCWACREQWAAELEEYPREFLEDIIRGLMKGGSGAGKRPYRERPWVVERFGYRECENEI